MNLNHTSSPLLSGLDSQVLKLQNFISSANQEIDCSRYDVMLDVRKMDQ